MNISTLSKQLADNARKEFERELKKIGEQYLQLCNKYLGERIVYSDDVNKALKNLLYITQSYGTLQKLKCESYIQVYLEEYIEKIAVSNFLKEFDSMKEQFEDLSFVVDELNAE